MTKPTKTASVPFMITKDQRQQLLDLGYTKSQINKLTPEQVQKILAPSVDAEPDIELPEKFFPPQGINNIPQYPEIERAILGNLLFNESKELVDKINAELVPQHFFLQSHQIIFQALIQLIQRGDSINPLLLVAELEDKKNLVKVGGHAFISTLTDGVAKKSDLSGEIRRIKDAHRRRSLLRLSQSLMQDALTGSKDGETIVLDLRDKIGKLTESLSSGSDLVKLSSIETQPVEWLWYPRIPLHGCTMIQGEEGIGKSAMVCAIAAAVTRGEGLEGMKLEGPGNVLWLGAEDDLARIVRPRMEGVGADLDRIYVKQAIFKLDAKGLLKFREYVAECQPKLIVIDPIIAYIEGDPNKPEVARAVTNGLTPITEEFDSSAILMRHIGKSRGDGDPRRAGLYSIEWRAAVRSELLVGCDPDDRNKKAVTHTKYNWSVKGDAIGYEIKSDITSPCGFRFHWTGISDLTEQKILQSVGNDEDAKIIRFERQETKEFLVELLLEGPKPQKEIEEETKLKGITYATLKRAKGELQILSFKPVKGPKEPWWWQLPPNFNLNGYSNIQIPLDFDQSKNGSIEAHLNGSEPLYQSVENKDVDTDFDEYKLTEPLSLETAPQVQGLSEPLKAKKKVNRQRNQSVAIDAHMSASEPLYDESSESKIHTPHCPTCGARLESDGSCENCSEVSF